MGQKVFAGPESSRRYGLLNLSKTINYGFGGGLQELVKPRKQRRPAPFFWNAASQDAPHAPHPLCSFFNTSEVNLSLLDPERPASGGEDGNR
jgi:hypothetical protein